MGVEQWDCCAPLFQNKYVVFCQSDRGNPDRGNPERGIGMDFNPGFKILPKAESLGFSYGAGVFGPVPEIRCLDDIRPSLADPACEGPKELYAISMDVGLEEDREEIVRRNLLYGAVVYAAGTVGEEPVRSQGHIHAVSLSCGSSTPEVYEIWEGEAIVYMQEFGGDDPGACYGIHAKAGDVVIVPPGWVHATVNGNITQNMCFGAWCVRDFGFEYGDVRSHGGVAYFPYVSGEGIGWRENPSYRGQGLIVRPPRQYEEFGIQKGVPIYTQFQENKEKFDFVVNPQNYKSKWEGFQP